MSTHTHPYVIEGGQAGKARLNVLSQALEPTDEFKGLVTEIATFEARPDTLVSLPRIFQVWGAN